MKASKQQVEQALKAPAAVRFFLFYGPDEAGSRSLARRLGATAGEGAERVELSGSELKSDPARLADEASSISLFGGARYVIVEANGDEVVPAVEALLEAPGGNPVAIVAGALKPASKLLKLALSDSNVLALASYVPEGRDADRLVLELGREIGLQMTPDVARRVADTAGGNRATILQELEKFGLYLGSGPDRIKPLHHDVIDLLGASRDEGDLSNIVDGVVTGNAALLNAELQRLASEGVEGIPLIRAVLRRLSLLARLRAEVEKGNSASSVIATQGKAIFWKEKDAVTLQLTKWRSAMLAKATSRLLEAERQIKASGGVGPLAANEELFAICRQAARLN